MTRNKVGPWNRKDYDDLLGALNCPLTIVEAYTDGTVVFGTEEPAGSLALVPGGSVELVMERPPVGEPPVDVDVILRWIQTNSVYLWLQQNPNFNKAWNTFQKRHTQALTGRPVSPRDNLHFLANVVDIAGRFFDAKAEPTKKREKTRMLRRQAQNTVRKLRGLIRQGIHLKRSVDTRVLSALLDDLEEELTEKKSYEGPRADERRYTEWFAQNLQLDFAIASPTIVSAWAAMIGYTPDGSTIERYVSGARKKQDTLIAGLRSGDPRKRIEKALRRAGAKLV